MKPVEAAAGIGTTAAPTHQRLKQAAEQFEALMLGELLKPLNHASVDGSNSSDDSSGGPMQSYATEAVAGALAHSGALGFASRLVSSVERRTSTAQAKLP